MIKLLCALAPDEVDILLKNKEIKNSIMSNIPNNIVKQCIKNHILNKIGYDDGMICAIQKIDGSTITINEYYHRYDEFLPIRTGCVMFQLRVENDLVLSIDFEKFIEICSYKDKELIEELLEDNLKIGNVNSEYVISFLPGFDKTDCTLCYRLTDDWTISNQTVGDIPVMQLNRMEMQF